MPSNTWDYFKAVIIIQLFFGLGATMISHALPTQDYVTISQQITPEQVESMEDLSKQYNEDIERIRNPPIDLPIIDTAFILFYTGNIVIDAFLNSLFAIPSMATVIVKAFALFFPINPYNEAMLSLFIYALIAILYIIGIIGVIINIRSQGGLANVV